MKIVKAILAALFVTATAHASVTIDANRQVEVPTKAEHDALAAGVLNVSDTSTDPGVSFNEWHTVNASRPAIITIGVQTSTDGTSSGNIDVNVDESGGTTSDYTLKGAFASSNLPAGSLVHNVLTLYMPAGSSLRVKNLSDPNGNNQLRVFREHVL